MSGTSPQKDQLVHNNLAHKLLFWGTQNPGQLTLTDDAVRGPKSPLVWIEEAGFQVSKGGAEFILANLAREVLSHREVKIMKDMTKPPMTLRAALPAPPPAAMVPVDPNMAAASIF